MSASTPHETMLKAAVAGDNAALEALVRAHHDRVYRFGVRVCRDSFDADDAVQEAFTKLAQRPDVVRNPGALSWLFSVVWSTCMRLLRPFSKGRVPLGATGEEVASIPSDALGPHEALERWRLVEAVHLAIAKLPQAQREVLVLRDLEGLSGPEVAQALHLDETAMKSRLHRARNELRSSLAPLANDVRAPMKH